MQLRGLRRSDDLTNAAKAPPEADLGDAGRLVSARDEEAALRMIREAGYKEPKPARCSRLVGKVEGYGKPEPGVC